MGASNQKSEISLLKLFVIFIVVYILLATLFFYLAGEQLHIRTSRGNQTMLTPDSGTVELYEGTTVEQEFITSIQRLEQIDIQWGTYYRQNSGMVTIELYDARNSSQISSRSFDVSELKEGGVTSIKFDTPLEGFSQIPLLIKIYSQNGQAGSSVSPLMNTQTTFEGSILKLNGNKVSGTLCFSAKGTDYIWTGLHYWSFVTLGFLLLVGAFVTVGWRYRNGKRSYIINAIVALRKYRFLIQQLVSRDFKTKYKRSVLGMFWSFLNPLLMMSVQYFVFSTIFKSDISNYAVYLLVGIVSFNFFSEACNMSLVSILGNASLITKVYVPKYIYPLTRIMSSVVNLGISLLPLIIVCLTTGVQFHKSAILALYFLVCLIIFTLGLGLLLSSSMVFFRDTQFLWNVFSMVWMYATPIFYPESILPDRFKFILNINPLYYFLKNARICILDGISPEPVVYFQCMVIALSMLLLGSLIFRKMQDRFVLYL